MRVGIEAVEERTEREALWRMGAGGPWPSRCENARR